MKKKNKTKKTKKKVNFCRFWYRCYSPHLSRYSLSFVCGIVYYLYWIHSTVEYSRVQYSQGRRKGIKLNKELIFQGELLSHCWKKIHYRNKQKTSLIVNAMEKKKRYCLASTLERRLTRESLYLIPW